jgi:DNA-binding transcriptional MocR family regulator
MRDAFELAVKNIDISFEYPDPSGNKELRDQIKKHHDHWDGEVLITNSATEATYLALSQIRGGTLALNVPSYFGVIRQAHDLNIKVIEWETVDDLIKIKDCDAILLTSNFTPPTGKSFSDKDKGVIADFADDISALVIEDNAYEFLSFSDKQLTAIPAKSAIRINSFSKLLSPNLRMGFIVAESDILSEIRSKKITMNLSSSPISQSIISAILKDDKIVNLWRRELKERNYLAKKEILKTSNISVEDSDGGSFIKYPLKPGTDINNFIKRAKENGLLIDNNKNQYMNNQPQPYLRIHLGSIAIEDIIGAIKILSAL